MPKCHFTNGLWVHDINRLKIPVAFYMKSNYAIRSNVCMCHKSCAAGITYCHPCWQSEYSNNLKWSVPCFMVTLLSNSIATVYCSLIKWIFSEKLRLGIIWMMLRIHCNPGKVVEGSLPVVTQGVDNARKSYITSPPIVKELVQP